MHEVIQERALHFEDAVVQFWVFTFAAMLEATALLLEVRVEFRRGAEGVGGKGIFRQRGQSGALFGGFDGFERHGAGGLALHGTFDIDAADLA